MVLDSSWRRDGNVVREAACRSLSAAALRMDLYNAKTLFCTPDNRLGVMIVRSDVEVLSCGVKVAQRFGVGCGEDSMNEWTEEVVVPLASTQRFC